MRASIKCAGTNRIRISGVLIDHNIVGISKTVIVRIIIKCGRWIWYRPKPCKIEYLHTMATGFAYYESMVIIRFHISPGTITCMCREFPEINGIGWI